VTDRRLELDAVSLKALAHPLRTRMLRVLQLRGRVSVTSLAAELGETTGATSYHLRQLARHGFVEEFEPDDPLPADAATPATGRRQKWWRMAIDEVHLTGFGFLADDDTREAVGFLTREWEADRSRRMANWFATALEWSEQWQLASSDSDDLVDLDPVQTRAMADELRAVVAKYKAMSPGPEARKVDVQYAVYPTDDGTRA
jgi:DNA-binding transcriptional ArsR family regulator